MSGRRPWGSAVCNVLGLRAGECCARPGQQTATAVAYTSPSFLRLPCPTFLRCCSQKLDGPYDDRVLPVVLTCVMMTFLTVVWIGSIVRWVVKGTVCCRSAAAVLPMLCTYASGFQCPALPPQPAAAIWKAAANERPSANCAAA